jgi:hypothetical protein
MQQDYLAALIRPEQLRDKLAAVDGPNDDGRMIFSGTIASHGNLPAPPYDVTMRLTDSRRRREIYRKFQVSALLPFK